MSGGSVRQSVDKFIRSIERDDVLLYVTAVLGVLLPGCVYFFYTYAHKLYTSIAQDREKEERERKWKQTALTVFHSGDEGELKDLLRLLGQKLYAQSPPIVDLADINPADFTAYRGVALFMISCEPSGREPRRIEWFYEWLEDLASDRKRTKLPCALMHYAVFGIDERFNNKPESRYNRATKVVARRLHSIGAEAICPTYLVQRSSPLGLRHEMELFGSEVLCGFKAFKSDIFHQKSSFWGYSKNPSPFSVYDCYASDSSCESDFEDDLSSRMDPDRYSTDEDLD